jgi:integrase
MPSSLLSALDIKNATCPADKNELRLKDGGGLFVRVGKDGYKAFIVRVGQRVHTLGKWPELNLAEARKRAAELRPLRRGLANPIEEARQRERQVKRDEDSERRRKAADGTAQELFERFVEIYGAAHWTTGKRRLEMQGLWKRHAKEIAPLPRSEVRREHLVRACDKLIRAGKRDTANSLHKLVRQIFSWGRERELVATNVFADAMRKPAPNSPPKQRALSFEEIGILLHDRLPAATNVSLYLKDAIRLILATACRPGEILGVKWQWINSRERLLRLPRTKNSLPFDVPLSDYALSVIEHLEKFRQGEWLIPQTMNPDKPARIDTLDGMVRDRQLADGAKGIEGRTKTQNTLLRLPDGRWMPHDLRRTAASRLGELGVAPHVIEDVLHHVPSRLVRTYQTYHDLPARRGALDLLGAALNRLERGESLGAKIVPLKMRG